MKHFLSSQNLTRDEILNLFLRAEEFLPTVKNGGVLDIAKGKILATLFFEPSTRTRFSFESAMLKLGGSVISGADMMENSSNKKGESLFDTGRVISMYADIIAMRHPKEGSVPALAKGSLVPIMNGGDGPADHPTQGLLDLFTIHKHLGRLENFTYLGLGDMKHSRVVKSDINLLRKFGKINFIFVSPPELRMPAEIIETLKSEGHFVVESDDMNANLPKADVLVQTRIQRERFASEAEADKYQGFYVIDPEQMSLMKSDAILMHPLPRIDEILPSVDADPRALYFEQVQNGVAVRMALIEHLLQCKN